MTAFTLSDVYSYSPSVFISQDDAVVTYGPTSVTMTIGNPNGQQYHIKRNHYCFKITIEDGHSSTTIDDMLTSVSSLPINYLAALEIVSKNTNDGLAIYRDLGADPPHSGRDHLNVTGHSIEVLLHELGHVIQEEVYNVDANLLSRWSTDITSDDIQVSTLGNTDAVEDMAEFSKCYAIALQTSPSKLTELQGFSPERFAEWETCLTRVNNQDDLRPNICKLSDTFIFDDSIFLPQNDCEVLFGPKAVTMQLNSHTGQRWNVKRGNHYFKITIQDGNPSSNVEDLLSTVSSLPTDYLAGLELVSGSTQDGLAIYNNASSLGGDSSSHDNYLNVVDYSIDILLHQIGHVIGHKLSLLNNWGTYKTIDIIEVSPLGMSSLSEDIAEFSKYYAFALQSGDSNLSELATLSPQRYTAWENGLTRVNNPIDLKSDISAALTPSVKIVKHHILRKNVIQNRHAFVHTMTRHINAAHPDAPIGQGQIIDSSPKYEDVFTSPEPIQVKDMNWDGSNYVMPDEHSANYIIDGNDVKDYQQDVENANISIPLPEFSGSNWVEDVTSGS